MREIKVIIDGEEYVALPQSVYAQLMLRAGGDADPHTDALIALGRTVRAARAAAGLTQTQLASRIGKTQPTISAAESGRLHVTEDYVARILAACGLPADWQVGDPRRPQRRRSAK